MLPLTTLLTKSNATSKNKHYGNSCGPFGVAKQGRGELKQKLHCFFCFVFIPLRVRLYIVRANAEELAIVTLIAEQERIRPRRWRKWHMFLGEVGVHVRDTNNKRSMQCVLRTLETCAANKRGAKTKSMDAASEIRCAHGSANNGLQSKCAADAFHNESRTTHTTQSCPGKPLLIENNLSIIYHVGLSYKHLSNGVLPVSINETPNLE